MPQSDAELVDRVRQGDAAAFEVLMRRHFRMAFLVAFAQLLNREDAEDVCQDAFLRCWERIHDCREPHRVAAWIGRIVRNMASNRRDYVRLRVALPLERARDVASSSAGGDAGERQELRERPSAAMRSLSVPQREVVLLFDLEGLRHAEIANRLGISEMMCRRHLSNARKRLRSLLKDLVNSGSHS